MRREKHNKIATKRREKKNSRMLTTMGQIKSIFKQVEWEIPQLSQLKLSGKFTTDSSGFVGRVSPAQFWGLKVINVDKKKGNCWESKI